MSKLYLIKNKYLAVLLFFLTTVGYSQIVVTGKVISAEDKSGLPGVSIQEKGTNNGTVTNVDGTYSLNVNSGAVLVYSFIGYISQEITVGSQATINVTLSPDVKAIEEVVVVGYGTQEKKEITAAVSTIKAAEMNRGNITDVAQLLQGKISGLVIARPGGDPNGGYDIRLRGVSSLGSNTQPLVVIDGVIGADMNSIDPNDIESVAVLKDGAAAAIYGVLGSSGVILVTTKRGIEGKPMVSYNGFTSWENIARTVQVMNREEFLEAGGNDRGANTDWFKQITRTGFSHTHNVSMSGAADKTDYRVSFNYREIEGVAKKTGFNQLNGRVSLAQRALNDKLTLSLNLTTTLKNSEYGFSDAFRYATIYNPTAPARDENNTANGGYYQESAFDYFNPVAIINQNVFEGQLKRLNFHLQGDYELIRGLTIMGRYARNNSQLDRGRYFSRESLYMGAGRRGLAEVASQRNFNQSYESTLTYNKTFGDLNFTALGGYSYLYFEDEGFGTSAGDFLSDAGTYHNLAAARDFSEGLAAGYSYKSSRKNEAVFGRLTFNYKDTYYLQGIVRREGSSMFGKNNRYAVFPAVSAGVTISNLVDIPTVENLKIRASYGVTGNLPISPYLSLSQVGPQGNTNFLVNGVWQKVYGPLSNPNPDLKWETKTEYDLGLDFSLLRGRIVGTFDYYTRSTKDLIILQNVPQPPNIFQTTYLNSGEIQNSGIEFELMGRAISNSTFTWTPSVNLATFNTKIVSLSAGDIEYGERDIAPVGSPGMENNTIIRVKEGQPLGQIYGPVYQGIGENGKWKFKDVNGDGVIDNLDREVIGNGLPKMQIGFNNSFTYKGFDFNFFLRGTFGHDLVNTFRVFYETKKVSTTYNVVKTKYYNPDLTESGRYSSHQVEKADFIKLDNVTLGYTLNAGKELFSKIRFYVTGQNLFVITNYSGVDPEVRYADRTEAPTFDANAPSDPLAPGIDRRNNWFRTRTITAGLNLTF